MVYVMKLLPLQMKVKLIAKKNRDFSNGRRYWGQPLDNMGDGVYFFEYQQFEARVC